MNVKAAAYQEYNQAAVVDKLVQKVCLHGRLTEQRVEEKSLVVANSIDGQHK